MTTLKIYVQITITSNNIAVAHCNRYIFLPMNYKKNSTYIVSRPPLPARGDGHNPKSKA